MCGDVGPSAGREGANSGRPCATTSAKSGRILAGICWWLGNRRQFKERDHPPPELPDICSLKDMVRVDMDVGHAWGF